MLRHVRAVVFDLDGTLVDSLDDIADHLDGALIDHGLPTPTRDEVRAWVGDGAAALVARAGARPEDVAEVLARFRARYRLAPVMRTRVYAGLDLVLDALVATSRRLGVLSNKPHDLTVPIADQLLARWPFGAIAGQRPGVPLKPDPAAAIAIAAALGCDPGECALVGDSEIDVETARAAGMVSVAVSWGLRELAVLQVAAPDHLVATPAELGALFEAR